MCITPCFGGHRAGRCPHYPSKNVIIAAVDVLWDSRWDSFSKSSGVVFLVANFFHPIDSLSIERLGDGDVRHCRSGCCAMPMLLTGFEPSHVTWTNLLNWSALSLHPSASIGDDQRLTEWMSMPCGTSTGLERHNPASDPRRCISLEHRIDSHCSGKPIRGSLCRRLRSYPCDFHCVLPLIDLCLAGRSEEHTSELQS